MRRLAVACLLALSGCGSRTGLEAFADPTPSQPPPRGPTAIPPTPNQARADRIDLLFVIDDSGSMTDKQQILARALPDLVDRLINPLCVEQGTLRPAVEQPDGPLVACPAGTLREFNSVQDLHIGVVSSSLGGMGAASCGPGAASSAADDRGELLSGSVETYLDKGFVAWDPGRTKSPPGETDLATLRNSIERLLDVGENGCPYEMPLEAFYRFLIEPEPYESFVFDDCIPGSGLGDCARPDGVNEDVLEQRRAFLRHDSLVAIIVLSDENDCSVMPGGLTYRLFDPPGVLPRATSACSRDANDPCCHSCGTEPVSGCVPPSADSECLRGNYTPEEDGGYLRCVDQKRRFGVDVRHPIDRYVNALRGEMVPLRSGALVNNPLFYDADGESTDRDPSLVFFAAIVGVPWQDIAVNYVDTENLVFKTASEMHGDGTWDVIVGDLEGGVLPTDPLMHESVEEREGMNPITGAALAPSSSLSPRANPINGHEAVLGFEGFNVQSACVFDLPSPVGSLECNGFSPARNQVVCQADDGSYGQTQYRAAAYPGLRELAVLKGIGDNAIVGSICARNVLDESRPDFGYRPALRAILDRLRVGLD